MDGTSDIVASGYRVFLAVTAAGSKSERATTVGLAVKEKIVKRVGKDVITIECISARLLKAQISNK